MSFEIKPERRKTVLSVLFIFALFTTAALDMSVSPRISFLLVYVSAVLFAADKIGGAIAYSIALLSATLRVWVSIIETEEFDALGSAWLWFSLAGVNYLIVYLLTKKNELLCELEKTSLTDHLTDLPNRRAFRDRLQISIAKTRRSHVSFSVAYIDVDNFKVVNDLRGHDEGDTLLVTVASVLRSHLRREDMAARLGGDEFAMVFEGSISLMYRIKEELDAAMAEKMYNVSFSIGVITYNGEPDVLCDDLIKFADTLMYRVKKTSKDGIFQSDLSSASMYG